MGAALWPHPVRQSSSLAQSPTSVKGSSPRSSTGSTIRPGRGPGSGQRVPGGKPGARAVRLIRPRSRVRFPSSYASCLWRGLAVDARHLARGARSRPERPTRGRPSEHNSRSAPASASPISTRSPGFPDTSRTGAQLDAERSPFHRLVRQPFPQPEIVKSSGRGEHGADVTVADTGWVDRERTTGHPAEGVRRAQRRPGAEQIQEAYNFSAPVAAAVIITHR